MAAVMPTSAAAPTDAPCACVAPDLSWIQTLPKVEMHAHLSGSVKDSTIRAMLREEAEANGDDVDTSTAAATAPSCLSAFISGERTLSQCFEVFALLHRLLSSLDAVARVTREVIADFAADEVVYLELRTTPRALPAKATSKRHVRTPSGHLILVRLLLSIDRSGTQADAESTVDLAAEFASHPDPVVVGIDFSGNPTVSSFRAFAPHFARARNLGLKASVHVGEKQDDGADLDAVLGPNGFRPERIGHVVCIEARHTAALLAAPIPIEICPTSNLKTRIVQRLEHHPFGTWRAGATPAAVPAATTTSDDNSGATDSAAAAAAAAASSYPLVVCTDDSGVFNITLSSELHRLATAFHMDRLDLLRLETAAVEHAFVDEGHKRRLRKIFEQFRVQQEGETAEPDSAAAVSALPVSSDPRPVAILTCVGQDEWKASDRALLAAFRSSGRAAEPVVWNDPSVRWERYRGAVIRSVWDYHLSEESVAHLLRVLGQIEAAGVALLNPLATVRWNHTKTYLRDLAHQQCGVATVDSLWVESMREEGAGIAERIRERGWNDCVIKPQISASGNLTFRFALQPDEAAAAAAPGSPPAPPALASWSSVLDQCVASGMQRWLLQPFCPEVLSEGEWSFVFLNGDYSHCVLSTPAGGRSAAPAWVDPEAPVQPVPASAPSAPPSATQVANSFMVQASHGGSFRYVDPDASLIAQARSMLHATAHGRDSLYARVDCMRRGDQLLLSELELVEPELFGRGVEGFQRKFVDAIEKRLAAKTQQPPSAC